MKNLGGILVIFIWCCFSIAAQNIRGVRVPDESRKVALVVGNADYDSAIGKLRNPINDAIDMAAAFQRLGFSLVGGKAQLNLDRRQMIEQIYEFGRQIKQGGVGVFYFSGHGVQVDRQNYLIPITNTMLYQENAESEAVNVDTVVLKEMERAGNSLNILILDACRNNGLPKDRRDIYNGLIEPSHKPSGVYIAFAARDGQTASENATGRNGLYTQELLKNLETPNLRLEDIFINTRREVKRLSNRAQEPIEYGSLDAPFYLKLINNFDQPPLKTSAAESAFYHAIENSSEIEDFENYLRRCESGEFTGIYASTAELMITRLKKANIAAARARFRPTAKLLLKYDGVNLFSEDLAGVELNNKYGFIDKTGEEVIPPKYDYVGSFSKGLAVAALDNKYGFIDKTGKEVIPLKYDLVDIFSKDLTRVILNNKWGFIDRTGKEVIPLKYNDVWEFSEDLARVEINQKYGYIDKTGKEVVPLKYDNVDSFSEGLAVVEFNNKWGYIDKTGKEVIPLKYDVVYPFSDGLAKVNLNSKHGYIDKTGKEVIPPKYDYVYPFSEGLAGVELNNKWGFIDRTGKEVIPLKYDAVYSFSEGLAKVKFDNKYGFINKAGKEVVPSNYDNVYSFSEGLAWVKPDNKWELIDKTGKEVVPSKYDNVDSFSEGLAKVKLINKYGYIDKTGKEVIPLKYDEIWSYVFRKEGFIGVSLDGRKGFVDIYGNEYFDF